LEVDMIKAEGFTDAELERFGHWQATSYAVLNEVVGGLTEGSTEKDATRHAMRAFRREGADRFFHLPVALFGERTTLPDPWSTRSFWPGTRTLQAGDAVILDASPVFEGFLVDTSVSVNFGPPADPGHTTAMADNVAHRQRILTAVRSGATFQEIAVDVDARLRADGYQNRHRLHPGEVLGHRVVRFTDPKNLPAPGADGFDTSLLDWFVTGIREAQRQDSVPPTWSDGDMCHHRPAPGLWAVEPHIARGSIGVKWEELLEITESGAHWLSDAVPHLASAVP
jgi:Xaa-Pro aminopeptidase